MRLRAATGSFSNINLVVPAKATPGTHWISAVQPASHTGAQAPFLVQTDWSQLGFDANHDQWNPFENQLNRTTVNNLIVDWTYPAAGTPSLVGESLFFGSSTTVYALNAASGSPVWQYTTGGQIAGGSPAVENGIVYVGSGDYSLYALDAADGTLAWHYSTASYVVSQPVVANGIVYVGSDDNTVYALQVRQRQIALEVRDRRAPFRLRPLSLTASFMSTQVTETFMPSTPPPGPLPGSSRPPRNITGRLRRW